jgi:hypothetical protein
MAAIETIAEKFFDACETHDQDLELRLGAAGAGLVR